MKRNLLFLLVAVVMASCSRPTTSNRMSETMSHAFEVETAVNDSIVELPVEINLLQWAVAGDTLYALSTDRERFLKIIDMKDMSLLGAIGNIGQGPEDFVSSSIIPTSADGIYLGDATKSGIRRVVGTDSIGTLLQNKEGRVLFNYAYISSLPYIRRVELSPAGSKYVVQDFSTGEFTDTLNLPIEPVDSKRSHFTLASHRNHSVAAYQEVDRFEIIFEENNQFKKAIAYKGGGAEGENNFFYVDVDCGPDFFALLSMKDKDAFSEETTPDILIYGYDGSPKAKLHLDFMAVRILVDAKNQRILLLGTDDRLHLVDFGRLIGRGLK